MASRFADTALNPNPGTTTVAPVTFNLRYPGQYADSESGLSYNYFRSYSPNTGRYVQPDPIGLDGGWNRFAYVEANPLMFTDPQGLQAVDSPNAALESAIARGDVRQLEAIVEGLGPTEQAAARKAIEKFNSNATDWIAKNCKGSINREFPGQFKGKTLKEILDQSRSGDSAAKKAWKLLNDNRFQK